MTLAETNYKHSNISKMYCDSNKLDNSKIAGKEQLCDQSQEDWITSEISVGTEKILKR